jgi:hypothetical protein
MDPSLSSEVRAEISRLVDDKKGDFAQSVTSAVGTAFSDSREAIAKDIGEKVKEALKGNQSVVLATVQSAAPTSKGNNKREWAVILVPIIATALLGYLVWRWQHAAEDRSQIAQTHLQEKIDQNSEFLKAQLALNQEYVKRKMDAFQEIWKQIAIVYADANTARINPKEVTRALNSLTKLSELLEANRLYISDATQKALAEFWGAAHKMTMEPKTPARLDEKLANAKKEVHTELGL